MVVCPGVGKYLPAVSSPSLPLLSLLPLVLSHFPGLIRASLLEFHPRDMVDCHQSLSPARDRCPVMEVGALIRVPDAPQAAPDQAGLCQIPVSIKGGTYFTLVILCNTAIVPFSWVLSLSLSATFCLAVAFTVSPRQSLKQEAGECHFALDPLTARLQPLSAAADSANHAPLTTYCKLPRRIERLAVDEEQF